ncbi:MAG: AMP-binding protein, partial [Rickettsiales bacterium]|nr:AMP-binding protein [Rickettsiales bacterium]
MTNSDAWVDGLTIGQVLEKTASRFPERDALVFPASGVRMNYAQFYEEVKRTAKGLLGMGIKPGEHVGIWATNLPQWVLLQYAAASVGVVLVTINPAYRPFELSYTLAQSDLVALFLTDAFKSSDYYAIFAEVCPQVATSTGGNISCDAFPKLRHVVAVKPGAPQGFMAWEAMLAAGENIADARLAEIAATLEAKDVINIQYTSGTTGFPKAAMLSHRNIVMNGWYVTGCQNITEQDRMCIPVPFYHCFGCVMGSLGAVTRGAAMVIPAEYFSPADTLSVIEAEQCSTVYGVPTMFVAMLDDAGFKDRTLSSLRSGIMAGSPCPIEVMRKVIDVMGCKDITIAYGQTETSPVVTQSRVGDPIDLRVETVGKELPGVELKVVNPETGAPVADGEQGEICARGHGTMWGYYKNEEATRAA